MNDTAVMLLQLALAGMEEGGVPLYSGPIDGKIGTMTVAGVSRLCKMLGLDAGLKGPEKLPAPVELPDDAVMAFFLAEDGDKYVREHFQVGEFACHDNSNPVFIHVKIPDACELARTINGAFTPSSAYRTPSHNNSVDGATSSQHMLGYAVDIPAVNATPEELYQLFDADHRGGLGIYDWGVHVDFGPNRRWDSRT